MIDTFVVFLAADVLPADTLVALIDAEVERNLVPDDVVLVVRETSRAAAVAAIRNDRDLKRLRHRLTPHATVTVIGFDRKGAEAGRDVAIGDGEESGITLEEIARRSATAIFLDHGGFVEASASYHFRNPSGRHTDRFMRLSNLLVRHAEISIIAMALLPLIPDNAVQAHIDTPSMFALVAAVNEHLSVLQPGRQPLQCDSFRSYLGVASYDFGRSETAIVLISATSSGSLGSIVEARKVDRSRIAHVLYLGASSPRFPSAVDLSYDKWLNPLGITEARETYREPDCAMCDAGSIAVDLRGDQFDLSGPEFEPITLNKNDASDRLAPTMDRLAGSAAFGVSLAAGATARQYVVDADRLLQAPGFAKRLDYFAKTHVPSSTSECIILNDDSRLFAEDLINKAGIKPVFVTRSDIDALDRADLLNGVPLNGSPIVIAAAVIESGRALLDISRDLRKVRPSSPQIYVVGLVKSASAAGRQHLEKTLIQTQEPSQHRFAAIEELILPSGGGPNAWQAELAFLDDAVVRGATLSESLQARLALLRKTSDPLTNELFVAGGATPLVLQPGFVFWPAELPERTTATPTQADVFYTISNVLQKLRTTAPKPGARVLRANWFQQTLLDPSNLGRFNDGVIQASLLRAARPTEIDFSGEAGARLDAGRIVGRIIDGAHRPRGEAAAEALIALGSGRLRLPTVNLTQILVQNPSHPPLVAELVGLCRARLL
ncbi:hypothetical protein TPR58_02765 [Sphingomonas sp. HF-S3]|uniref:Uncharacterized protein n=1 Tax=Sphingomonas rustica TaxID=3103142 RepID=A0ABV0B3A6_9SPHN